MEFTSNGQTAAIVGGGIGGLTAALALAHKGWQVSVFEQSAEFGEIGAGLQLSSNASCVLRALGLGNELSKLGFLPQGIEIRDGKSGRELAAESLGEQAMQEWGSPYYHIHRADLQKMLLKAVTSHPNTTLNKNSECTAIKQTESKAQLTLASGDQISTDLLIGADGIHSIVRENLWGAASANFTGNVAWRLMIPASELPDGLIKPVASLWMGPGAHFVHYFVRNGEWVNCVCVVEQDNWQTESWNEPGEKSELKKAFKGWHKTIKELINAADDDSCYRWALFDRDPLPHWHRGRVTLLGDACHPTLPFLAQGAAMAIEDAAVLAHCLDQTNDVDQALTEYEELRKSRTAKVQKTSRRNGRIYHLSGPAAAARNLAMRTGLASPRRTTDWLFSYDATKHR